MDVTEAKLRHCFRQPICLGPSRQPPTGNLLTVYHQPFPEPRLPHQKNSRSHPIHTPFLDETHPTPLTKLKPQPRASQIP